MFETGSIRGIAWVPGVWDMDRWHLLQKGAHPLDRWDHAVRQMSRYRNRDTAGRPTCLMLTFTRPRAALLLVLSASQLYR